MPSIGKLLIILGCIFIVLGLLINFLPKMPYLGKLPGDIRIEKENFSFYFPITTCIIISLLLSFFIWLFQKK